MGTQMEGTKPPENLFSSDGDTFGVPWEPKATKMEPKGAKMTRQGPQNGGFGVKKWSKKGHSDALPSAATMSATNGTTAPYHTIPHHHTTTPHNYIPTPPHHHTTTTFGVTKSSKKTPSRRPLTKIGTVRCVHFDPATPPHYTTPPHHHTTTPPYNTTTPPHHHHLCVRKHTHC